ncbi:MAG: hypothetical protein OXF79_10815 [Chloroflexi bacterium]|nr:hypothetical protein [Chloroflexota bacterium]
MPPFARNSHTLRSQRVENIPCRHPDPDCPAAGLHVSTSATTSGRQRHCAAGGGNYITSDATGHRDADGGTTCRRSSYTHADAHLTASPADGYGYGYDQHYYN